MGADYKTDVTIDRTRGIGGSDMPAVMGISPFTTRMDLLMEKAKLKDRPVVDNEYINYGNVMESKIRAHINSEHGYNFTPDYKDIKEDVCDIFYHADGIDKNNEVVLEVKTTSEIHEDVKDYKVYLVQLLLGMYVWGYKKGVLAVYERPEDMDEEFDPERLTTYEVLADDYAELWGEELRSIEAFKRDLLYIKDNPLASEEELPSRHALAEIADRTLVFGDLAVNAEWLLGNEKDITTAIKDMKEEICKAMADNNITKATFANGTRVTYVPQGKDTETEKLDDTRLKKEEPSIYAKYLKKSVRKGKKAYVIVKH